MAKVAIIVGSDSDLEKASDACTVLEELGVDCVFSSEWDKFSQITYEANFGEVPYGDITKIDEKDIPKHD